MYSNWISMACCNNGKRLLTAHVCTPYMGPILNSQESSDVRLLLSRNNKWCIALRAVWKWRRILGTLLLNARNEGIEPPLLPSNWKKWNGFSRKRTIPTCIHVSSWPRDAISQRRECRWGEICPQFAFIVNNVSLRTSGQLYLHKMAFGF